MATFEQGSHPYADEELISGSRLSTLLGVSKEAVSKALRTESGRLDQWRDSTGRLRLHPVLSVEQWTARRASNFVTTTTRAQAAAGMGNHTAQATAHLGNTNPKRTAAQASTPTPGTDQAREEEERHNLAMSRAERERHNARLLEIRVREKEGTLVDRAVFYQKAYAVGNAIKDQLNGLPAQIGPQVVSAVEESLVANGLAPDVVRAALDRGNVEHVAREALRLGILRALRALTARPVEDLFG